MSGVRGQGERDTESKQAKGRAIMVAPVRNLKYEDSSSMLLQFAGGRAQGLAFPNIVSAHHVVIAIHEELWMKDGTTVQWHVGRR